MQWIELSIRADPRKADEVAAFLGKYASGGPAVERWEDEEGKESFLIKIYLPNSRSFKSTHLEIIRGLAEFSLPDKPLERRLKPEDWMDSLKQHFGILEIGERFIIKPSWLDLPSPSVNRIVIQLDPGSAFGTGLHATTRLCLLSLEKYLGQGMTVVDVGTGSGILAIAALKLGAGRVLALDIDGVAVRVTRGNAEANGIVENIEIRRGTLSRDKVRKNKGRFDLALANITVKAICGLAPGFLRVLKPGGRLVASGINTQGLDEVLVCLAVAGFTLEAADRDGEWYAVTARKNE